MPVQEKRVGLFCCLCAAHRLHLRLADERHVCLSCGYPTAAYRGESASLWDCIYTHVLPPSPSLTHRYACPSCGVSGCFADPQRVDTGVIRCKHCGWLVGRAAGVEALEHVTFALHQPRKAREKLRRELQEAGFELP